MYCPVCLNETLRLNSKGVADVIINKRQMDNGRFLFNIQTQTTLEIKQTLEKKLREFFRWYSSFQNVEAITSIEIVSNNFSCANKCSIEVTRKFSVMDLLLSEKEVVTMAQELASQHKLNFQLKL